MLLGQLPSSDNTVSLYLSAETLIIAQSLAAFDATVKKGDRDETVACFALTNQYLRKSRNLAFIILDFSLNPSA